MTISKRAVKMLMHKSAPGTPISNEAVEVLRSYLEEKGRSLSEHASRIQDKENDLRKSLGVLPKIRLSAKHMRMAIHGKFTESNAGDDQQQS